MQRFVIVTPCLNAERFINETIHSVVSQAGPFEIRYHVQDAGSSDRTLALIDRWDALIRSGTLPLACEKLSFTHVSAKDSGLYDGINRGFEHVGIRDEDWMGWINADDILAPGALATIAEITSTLGRVHWLSGRTAHVDAAGRLMKLYALRPYLRKYLARGLHDGRWFPLVSQEGTFWEGSLWRTAGPLDARFMLAGDYDLWKRFAAHADLFIVNSALAYFRVHEEQKSSNLSSYYGEIDVPEYLPIANRADPALLRIEAETAGLCERDRRAWHFITHGIDRPVLEFTNENEAAVRSGVFAALEHDQPDILRQYFEDGVRADITNAEGMPLYLQSLMIGNIDAFEICASLDPDAVHERHPHRAELLKKTLIEAIERDNTRLARKLIGLGVPLNERSGDNPLPLMVAIQLDYLPMARMLVKHGADVDATDEKGVAILLNAIYLNRIEHVRMLMEAGADPSVTTKEGRDALAFAEEHGRERIAEILSPDKACGDPVAARGGDGLVLDVCICTHNPRRAVFDLVIRSVAKQDAAKSGFRVLVVDNASNPELVRDDFAALAEAGIDFRIVLEPRLGNIFSRATAIAESTSEWILFVDDDNELAPDYISQGLAIIHDRPELGCFGGRLYLAPSLAPPQWMVPLLPYLAVRDFGDAEITNVADFWGQWEPATAGGFVHRSVLDLYIDRIQNDEKVHHLGRKGKRSLNSGEDSLMMWGAHRLGLAASYQPGLKLVHHINPDRFQFWYFFRLMRGYGRSNAILDKLYARPAEPLSPRTIFREILKNGRSISWRYAICLAAYHWGYGAEVVKP